MPFSAETSILTTDGFKYLKELVDKPFSAIINDQIFPCPQGVQKKEKGDLYKLTCNKGRRIFITINQDFLNMSDCFQNIQDFVRGSRIKYVSNTNISFNGDDNDERMERHSSDSLREYFAKLYYNSENSKRGALALHFKDFSITPVPVMQQMLVRFGVDTFLHRPVGKKIYNCLVGDQIAHDNFVKFINNEPTDPQENYVLFKKLEYYETAPIYYCHIEGVQAFDADCFYVRDSA